MSLEETLTADMKVALKARDKERLSTIRMLLSDVKSAVKDAKRPLEEQEELGLLASHAKRRRESIEAYRQGAREELAAKEEAELALIESYLPKPLTADEVRDLVRIAIDEVGATSKRDFGKVMGKVMPQVKGRFPGKDVQPIVNELLS